MRHFPVLWSKERSATAVGGGGGVRKLICHRFASVAIGNASKRKNLQIVRCRRPRIVMEGCFRRVSGICFEIAIGNF